MRAGLGPERELTLHRAYHGVLRRGGRFAPPEDPLTLAVLDLLAARAHTVLDIGANTGRYAHRFALHAPPEATVHAFEPHPRARALLEANTAGDVRVRVHPCALGAEDGTLDLAVPLDELGNPVTALAHLGESGPGEVSVPVQVRTLNGLVSAGLIPLDPPVLVKLDVEGHEGAVLGGAGRLLALGAPIYFESQEEHLRRAGVPSPWPLLRDAGYCVLVRDGDGWRTCDAPEAARPNYLALRLASPPAGHLSHARLVAVLAGWETSFS